MCRRSPRSGGPLGLVEEGDLIRVDLPARTLDVLVDTETLAIEGSRMEAASAPLSHPEPWPSTPAWSAPPNEAP